MATLPGRTALYELLTVAISIAGLLSAALLSGLRVVRRLLSLPSAALLLLIPTRIIHAGLLLTGAVSLLALSRLILLVLAGVALIGLLFLTSGRVLLALILFTILRHD
jgi:hypothetical protein